MPQDTDIVFVDCGGCHGSFVGVRRRFPLAIVIGFVSAFDGSLHLNPEDGELVVPGDKLVLLKPGVGLMGCGVSHLSEEISMLLNPEDGDLKPGMGQRTRSVERPMPPLCCLHFRETSMCPARHLPTKHPVK